ncbi:hypothetical protein H0X10_04465 [Candidatus Saccharibacteria bacterium]|nr:hypothetical protein [Candidatus Saccharibacteria bacterium]
MSEVRNEFEPRIDDLEKVFFDCNHLPAIDEIDLHGLRHTGKLDFTPGSANNLDPKMTVRYLSEAAEGMMDDETFDDLYEQAIGKVLEGSVKPEHLEAIYETLENQRPRVIELLRRVRNEQILPDQEFVTINKVTLFVAALKLVQSA